MEIKSIESISLNLADGRSIELKPYVEPDRYYDFTFLPTPVAFSEAWKGKKEDLVQVHSTSCGFCGVFSWDGEKLTSLDGDSYNPNMKVIGYSYFDTDDGECLDILVGNDW